MSTVDSNATAQAFAPLLAKGQKVIAANDVTGDRNAKVFLRKGKTLTIMTVSNASLQASSFQMPVLSPGFKLVATAYIETNATFVSTKGRNLNLYSGNQTVSLTLDPGTKVIGLSQKNLFLAKKTTIRMVPILFTANGLAFGNTKELTSLPKEFKAVALRYVSFEPDIVIQKKTTLQVLTAPNYTSTLFLPSLKKKQKVVGAK